LNRKKGKHSPLNGNQPSEENVLTS
jgi:hypothetical protein